MLHAWNALNTCMFDPIFLQTRIPGLLETFLSVEILLWGSLFLSVLFQWFRDASILTRRKKCSFHGDQIHELIWVDWPWSSLYTSLKSVSIIYFYAHTFPSFETTKQRILKIVCIYLLRLLLHDPLIFNSFIKGSVTCVQPNNYNLLVNSHTYTCPKWTR